jgi:hypothetical protein
MGFADDVLKTNLINTLAGNGPNAGWAAADHQLKIITSEWNEFVDDGIKARNLKEVRDGLADLLFTLIGFAHRTGLDFMSDLHDVVESNMTKFDLSADDALRTRDKYAAIGIKTRTKYYEQGETKYYVTLTDGAQTATDGKEYIDGKWLKSVNFVDVDFSNTPATCSLVADTATPNDVDDSFAPLNQADDALNEADVVQMTTTIAVGTIVDMLNGNDALASAFEMWAAMQAYEVLSNITDPSDEEHLNGPHAIQGIQRFLSILSVDQHKPGRHYNAKVNPNSFPAEQFIAAPTDLTPVYAALIPGEAARFSRALEVLTAALQSDPGYQITWHANLQMAWCDAGIVHPVAGQIADLVFSRLFHIDTTHLYDRPADAGKVDDTAEVPA